MSDIQQRQSDKSRRRRLRTMMAGVLGSLLLLAIARFTLLDKIPENRYLVKTLTFTCPDNVDAAEARGLWPLFARIQELELKKIILSHRPAMRHKIAISHNRDDWNLIIRYRNGLNDTAKETISDLDRDFKSLVELYIEQFAGPGADKGSDGGAMSSYRNIKETLEAQLETKEVVTDKLIALEDEYARLASSCNKLEQYLSPVQPRVMPDHFREYAENRIRDLYSEDRQLEECIEKITRLEQDIKELDLEMAACESARLLEEMERRRDTLRRELQEAKYQKQQQQEAIEKQAMSHLWESYQQHVKAEIRQRKHAMQENIDKQLYLKHDLERCREKIDLLSPLLPSSAGESDDDQIAMAVLQDYPFGLKKTDTPLTETSSLSLMQILLLISSALIGGGLGIILTDALSLRTGGDRKAPEPEDSREAITAAAKTAQTGTAKPASQPDAAARSVPQPARQQMSPPRRESAASSRKPEKQTATPSSTRPETKKTPPPAKTAAAETPPEKTAPRKGFRSLFSRTKKQAEMEKTPPAATEQYDQLARKILTLQREVNNPVVLISNLEPESTSPRPTINLAIALARAGMNKILLIEAEPQRHDLARVFEQNGGPGFFEWRRGALWSSKVICETPLPQLSFMPVGKPAPDQCSKKTDISREAHRWGNLRKNYDAVIIYSPDALIDQPETPEQLAAVPLLDAADALVVQLATKSSPDTANQTVQEHLRKHRCRYLGTLVQQSGGE